MDKLCCNWVSTPIYHPCTSIVNPVDSVLDCGERDRRLGEDGAEALYVLAQPTSFVTLLLQTAG
ncbi:hypothetical protein MCOR13_008046 [Pyricularia oryzae]|uniref:Uncharacterized protein n=1 Tax=Pyricularia grisea TaxID=148305 RepID=A0ABQ8N727_PYRGI|nr:hypothetical protein MCOR01_001527 [Pyricularia oryzae]KAI6292345.1 hypothetical protein MCOR33_009940 [Pyricularia grisea]KAI6492201.1 hypothetical protein MCOR13_008046 [Pyricularia oryzae]